MKILFIENRYKTKLWELVADKLKDEHQIYWLVQNHIFIPSFSNVKKLLYPNEKYKNKVYDNDILKIISSNRGINYFGIKNDDFIFHYRDQINQYLEDINPDVVFGESTLFHELLVINACKRKKILYLHPSSTRYPKNRFSFYLNDSQIPYLGSKEKISNDAAIEILDSINRRDSLPDYVSNLNMEISFKRKIKDKLLLTISYILGERFNTPSPFRKYQLNRKSSKRKKIWDKFSTEISSISNEYFYILYPLQLQPEANIDVWGYPNNNQTELIKNILFQLKPDEKLILKPNPKSKYEISDELISLIQSKTDKLILLSHETNMSDIFHLVSLVVTVTGTISIECMLSNKPIIMFGEALQTKQKNIVKLKCSKDSIRTTVDLIKNGSFPKLSIDERLNFIKEVISTSYEGINGDGMHNIFLLQDNLNKTFLLNAYDRIIFEIEKTKSVINE